jgi:hypothetical protein
MKHYFIFKEAVDDFELHVFYKVFYSSLTMKIRKKQSIDCWSQSYQTYHFPILGLTILTIKKLCNNEENSFVRLAPGNYLFYTYWFDERIMKLDRSSKKLENCSKAKVSLVHNECSVCCLNLQKMTYSYCGAC